jgi:uroporphyrinogen decarboxylase
MTSRERVRAVLAHRIPDRIPNGLGGCETAGLHISAYDTLKRVLGSGTDTPTRLDTFMLNAVFEESEIAAMGGDIILLDSPNMCPSHLRGFGAGEWREQELWGKTYRIPAAHRFSNRPDGTIVWDTWGGAICPKGGYYFDHKADTDLNAQFIFPDPADYHPRDTIDDHILCHLEEQAKRLYEETDLSICLGESITDLQVAPGGMIGSMILMMEEPEVMGEFLEKSLEAGLKQIRLLEQAVGKYVDILSVAHDFGDNRGVTIGDELWRSVYKPYYHRFFHGWKEITGMKVNLHTCGSVSSILGDLIECGVDVFNPVQISAANMSPAELKARFGDRLVLWGGGYDAQLSDRTATYEEVYGEVLANIRELGRGGGYIFAGVHNLPADMPEAHIRAMLDALHDGGTY